MLRIWSLVALGSSAALALAASADSTRAPAAAQQGYFDPVLSGALCVSSRGATARPLGYFARLAQATETKPFSPQGSSSTETSADAPLFDDLGTLTFAVTTNNPVAQRYFDQGLRLAFAFNHAEAARAFRTAQQHDPACAMCAWGEALVLGPNINAPMEVDAVAPARAAVRKAQQKADSASAREQALIAAVAARYSADATPERRPLDEAYANAMDRVAKDFPDDDNIQVLYAESLMDLSPWDYWEQGGAKPKGRTAAIVASLETVLARSPEHPGAMHYYIHMMEASSAPEKALPQARRLAAAMPGAGHLVHMPFHIYYRVGDYREAVAANQAAVGIDEAYIAREKPVGIYPLAYYPHNVHSLMASAQMAGDGASAVPAAEKLGRIVTVDAARSIPMAQPVAVAQYYAHAQFSTPATTLALAAPPDDVPFVKAMWHYARGVAYAADKKVVAARKEADAIERLQRSDFSGLTGANIPAPQVLALARHIVLARIALGEGQLATARSAFEQAVSVQDQLPYSEPPFWYYPVRQSLAAVLLRMGDTADAEDQFRASLVQAPNNGWALFGLRELYQRVGRADAVAELDRRLTAAWAGDRSALDLGRL